MEIKVETVLNQSDRYLSMLSAAPNLVFVSNTGESFPQMSLLKQKGGFANRLIQIQNISLVLVSPAPVSSTLFLLTDGFKALNTPEVQPRCFGVGIELVLAKMELISFTVARCCVFWIIWGCFSYG